MCRFHYSRSGYSDLTGIRLTAIVKIKIKVISDHYLSRLIMLVCSKSFQNRYTYVNSVLSDCSYHEVAKCMAHYNKTNGTGADSSMWNILTGLYILSNIQPALIVLLRTFRPFFVKPCAYEQRFVNPVSLRSHPHRIQHRTKITVANL